MKRAIGLLLILSLSACSFQVEVGYHGKTGRSDLTETSYESPRVRNAKY